MSGSPHAGIVAPPPSLVRDGHRASVLYGGGGGSRRADESALHTKTGLDATGPISRPAGSAEQGCDVGRGRTGSDWIRSGKVEPYRDGSEDAASGSVHRLAVRLTHQREAQRK